jgi:hypothetical protein
MTVNEIFSDELFLKILADNIRQVTEGAVFNEKVKSNSFRTLSNKKLLNINGLKKEFALCMVKASKLSSGERHAVMVLVQDAIVKTTKKKQNEP